MANKEMETQKLRELTERIGQDIMELFDIGEISPVEIRNVAQGMMAHIADGLQNLSSAQLLYDNQNVYDIYQLKDISETRDMRFMGKDYLEKKGIEVSKENYNLVYSASLGEGMTLDGIYEKFNIAHPSDFTGHSLSVSDIVVLHRSGEDTSYYVDSFGFQEIPGFKKERQTSIDTVDVQAETTMPEQSEQTNTEQSKVGISYYVIEDLSSWANNSEERSALERFNSLSDAMDKFIAYRAKERDYSDGKAKTTLGVAIGIAEFDVLHVRENENYLVQDFMLMKVAEGNQEFLNDLQTIHNTIGFDKLRLTREMTPEEVKRFVKERFEHQMMKSGLDDFSVYIERFDSLYEQNRMESFMPTAN